MIKYKLLIKQWSNSFDNTYVESDHDSLGSALLELAEINNDVTHPPGNFHVTIIDSLGECHHEEEYKAEL